MRLSLADGNPSGSRTEVAISRRIVEAWIWRLVASIHQKSRGCPSAITRRAPNWANAGMYHLKGLAWEGDVPGSEMKRRRDGPAGCSIEAGCLTGAVLHSAVPRPADVVCFSAPVCRSARRVSVSNRAAGGLALEDAGSGREEL